MAEKPWEVENPYPESVFPPMDLAVAAKALQEAGLSPDRVFGNWGRYIWDKATKALFNKLVEWLQDDCEDEAHLHLRGWKERAACYDCWQALRQAKEE